MIKFNYNIRKWNPLLISIPDIAIGIMWGSLGNIVAFHAYAFSNNASHVAIIESIATFVGIFSQVLIGNISDRTKHQWGRRSPWIFYGMILAVLSILLWGFAKSFLGFFIIFTVTCFLINVVQCAYYAMIIEVVDEDQVGTAITLSRTSSTIGGFIVGGIAGFLWNAKHPEYTFCVMAFLMLLVTVSLIPLIIKERSNKYQAIGKFKISFDLLKNKNMLIIFLITFLLFSSATVVIQMSTSIFVQHYQYSEHTLGRLFMSQGIASIILGVVFLKFVKKIDSNIALTISMAGLFITFLILFVGLHFHFGVFFLYLTFCLYGVFMLTAVIAIYALIPRFVDHKHLGEYIGWLNLFIAAAQFIFVYIFGFVLDRGYYQLPILCGMGFYLIAFYSSLQLKEIAIFDN